MEEWHIPKNTSNMRNGSSSQEPHCKQYQILSYIFDIMSDNLKDKISNLIFFLFCLSEKCVSTASHWVEGAVK